MLTASIMTTLVVHNDNTPPQGHAPTGTRPHRDTPPAGTRPHRGRAALPCVRRTLVTMPMSTSRPVDPGKILCHNTLPLYNVLYCIVPYYAHPALWKRCILVIFVSFRWIALLRDKRAPGMCLIHHKEGNMSPQMWKKFPSCQRCILPIGA